MVNERNAVTFESSNTPNEGFYEMGMLEGLLARLIDSLFPIRCDYRDGDTNRCWYVG